MNAFQFGSEKTVRASTLTILPRVCLLEEF